MSTGTYLKPFRPPAPLKPGGASNVPGRKPWARRPPPKLCTSGFLSGSWKPPKRVTVAKPATSRLAKRCREVAAAHPPTVTAEKARMPAKRRPNLGSGRLRACRDSTLTVSC